MILADCSFVVSQAGRARVLRERVRHVHAWAAGTLLPRLTPEARCVVPVTYDPFRYGNFFRTDTGEPVWAARYLLFTPQGQVLADPN